MEMKMGFVRNIGRATSFLVELWGLKDGLTMALQHNHTPLVVETDAQAVAHIINSREDPLFHIHSALIWIAGVNRIHHVANSVADAMARKGSFLQELIALFCLIKCQWTSVILIIMIVLELLLLGL